MNLVWFQADLIGINLDNLWLERLFLLWYADRHRCCLDCLWRCFGANHVLRHAVALLHRLSEEFLGGHRAFLRLHDWRGGACRR